jgi:hypothetical protein
MCVHYSTFHKSESFLVEKRMVKAWRQPLKRYQPHMGACGASLLAATQVNIYNLKKKVLFYKTCVKAGESQEKNAIV